MCCFANPVLSVDHTKIFARLDGAGNQLLAYEMQYKSEVPNAMILPLPVKLPAAENSLSFIDLSGYDTFFKDLKKGFPVKQPPMAANSRSMIDSKVAIDSPLQVYNVGEFVASFVPSLEDFSRIDPRFVILPETWKKIPLYSDYSFAVFQFKELAAKPHPMAFSFKTRFDDKVFFPTVHIHDGEVHKKEKFDHDLYLQHAGLDKMVGRYSSRADRATKLTRSVDVAGEFVDSEKCKGVIEPDLLVHRRQLQGTLANQDIMHRVAGNPLNGSTSSLQRLRYYLPVAAMALPAAWIIRRRKMLSKQ